MDTADIEVIVDTLGPSLRAVAPVVGKLGRGFADKLQERALEQASDATLSWTARAWRAIAGGHGAQEAEDTEQGLLDLAADPAHRSTRRLLMQYLAERSARDESFAADLRSLLDDRPSPDQLAAHAIHQTVSHSVVGGNLTQVGVVHNRASDASAQHVPKSS